MDNQGLLKYYPSLIKRLYLNRHPNNTFIIIISVLIPSSNLSVEGLSPKKFISFYHHIFPFCLIKMELTAN
jgi:hypothetical protein